MSDNAITQNEINDLLSGGGGKSAAFSDTGVVKVLTTLGNTLLTLLSNDLAEKTGILFMPGDVSVEKMSAAGITAKLGETVVAMKGNFENLPGSADSGRTLFVEGAFAKKITELVNKEENAALDDMAMNILGEILSKYTADEVGELGKAGKAPGLDAPPGVPANTASGDISLSGEVFVITYPFNGDGTDYYIREVLSAPCAAAMAAVLPKTPEKPAGDGALSSAEINAMMGGAPPSVDIPVPPVGGFDGNNSGMGVNMGSLGLNIPDVKGVDFPTLGGAPGSTEQGNIGLIIDVFMEMTVELGRTKKQVKDILALGEGTIIELDKLAGEPVDILVNHKAIAKGEVVVIDENFGVRVTEILSPIERVNELR